jgi:hypothetical protein
MNLLCDDIVTFLLVVDYNILPLKTAKDRRQTFHGLFKNAKARQDYYTRRSDFIERLKQVDIEYAEINKWCFDILIKHKSWAPTLLQYHQTCMGELLALKCVLNSVPQFDQNLVDYILVDYILHPMLTKLK